MAELRIFDSQGERIDDDGQGQYDERIEDFFFDGVRFALDMRLSNEAVVFFRARETETSRSEQYYAVYKFRSQDELQHLGDDIKRVIEDEWGMFLDTSQDDTDVFELLVGDRSEERRGIDCPGSFEDRDDLTELVGKGTPISVGVGSYRDACGVFNEFITEESVNQIVIADDTSGSRLDGYDVAVEVGPYTGLEPMGDTEGALDRLREQRRQRLQPDDVGSSTPDGPVGYLLDLPTVALAGLAVVALLLLGGIGAVGACTVGVDVPVVCAGDDGTTVSGFGAEFNETEQRIYVSGAVAGATNGTMNSTVTVTNDNGTEFVNGTVPIAVDNGTFEHRLDQPALSPPAVGNYTVNVTTDGTSRTAPVNITAVDAARSVTGVGTLEAGAHDASSFWLDGTVSGVHNGSVNATVSLSGPFNATANRTLTVRNGSFNHTVPLNATDSGSETFAHGDYTVNVTAGDYSNETTMTVDNGTVPASVAVSGVESLNASATDRVSYSVNGTVSGVDSGSVDASVSLTGPVNATTDASLSVENSSFDRTVEIDFSDRPVDGLAPGEYGVNVTVGNYSDTAAMTVDPGTVLSMSAVSNVSASFTATDSLAVTVDTEAADATRNLSFRVVDGSDETVAGPFLHEVETDGAGSARQSLGVNMSDRLDPSTDYEVRVMSADDEANTTVQTPSELGITDLNETDSGELRIQIDGEFSAGDRVSMWVAFEGDSDTIVSLFEPRYQGTDVLTIQIPRELDAGTYNVTVVAFGDQRSTDIEVEAQTTTTATVVTPRQQPALSHLR